MTLPARRGKHCTSPGALGSSNIYTGAPALFTQHQHSRYQHSEAVPYQANSFSKKLIQMS